MLSNQQQFAGMASYFEHGQLPRFQTVRQIGAGLMHRTLPHRLWTHEAHIAAAVYMLMLRKDLDGFAVMPGVIRRYNEANGVENSDTGGFHATITEFYLRVISYCLEGMPGHVSSNDAFQYLLETPVARKEFPLNFYSPELLFSVQARRGWVDPDRARLEDYFDECQPVSSACA